MASSVLHFVASFVSFAQAIEPLMEVDRALQPLVGAK